MSDSAVFTTAELARRWRMSEGNLLNAWRAGSIPPPLNPQQTRCFRWSVAAVEAFETWQRTEVVA